MTAHEALQEARRRGITVTPAGASLRVRGTWDAMSEELEQALKKHKPEIIAILGEARSTHPCVRCERFVFIEPDVVCFWCRRAARVVHEA